MAGQITGLGSFVKKPARWLWFAEVPIEADRLGLSEPFKRAISY